MQKLEVHLEHCYGIKRLDHTFDFADGPAYAIYAPNGTMKSSLAQTFVDIAEGEESKDRMFPDRVTKRKVTSETGKEISPAAVFVVLPYDQDFQTEKTSLLLVNTNLRKEYEELFKEIDTAKTMLLEALKKQAKSKKIDVEAELLKVFAKQNHTVLEVLQMLRAKYSVEGPLEAPLKDVEYEKVFDEKVIGVLEREPLKGEIEGYIKRYNDLLKNSKYFKKDVFNYYDGGEVAKSLGGHGFFKAGHHVVMHADAAKDITSEKEIEKLIREEKEQISADPEIRKKFDAIDSALKRNVDLRKFEAYLCDHEEILPLLADIPEAKAKVWESYLKANFQLLNNVIDKYQKAEKRRREIELLAASQRTQWEAVVEIFNARFFVPFTLSVSNKVSAALGTGAPTLQFSFEDGTEKVAVNRDDLLRVLSQGERKALYILSIIFEVEARLHAQQESLFLVDDIADSFDYKNKYAIVQYLRDIQQIPEFRLIVLTHNFDFYRTIQSRFVPYNHCLMSVRTTAGIKLEKAQGIKNVFVNLWKKEFFTDSKKRASCIPFLRNLLEYTKGEQDPDYLWLTSLLHWRPNTTSLKQTDLDNKFNSLFQTSGSWKQPANVIVDDIFALAQNCLTEPEGINFENKIVLSIAIRLAAERYMVQAINDQAFWTAIQGTQTPKLTTKFQSKCGSNTAALEVLQRVELMTPENIHLNSFMYEPILDMSDTHLRKLYQDVLALK